MNNIKKIIFPLFSLFLLYVSFGLVKQLYYSEPIDYTFFESFLIAFMLTLFITGVFAFPGFAFSTSSLMPTRYYQAKNPVLLNRTYTFLGVSTFKSILVLLFWGRKNNRKRYYNGTREGLQNFLYQTKQSEFGHLVPLIITVILSIYLLFKGYVLLVIMITMINILGNLYPIILQRHHRIKIYQLAEKLKA